MTEKSFGRFHRRPLRRGKPTLQTEPPVESRQETPAIPEQAPKPAETPSSSTDSTPAPQTDRAKKPYDRAPRPDERQSRPRSGLSGSRERGPVRRTGDRDRRQPPIRPARPVSQTPVTTGLKLESIALPILTVMAGTAFLYFSAPIIVPLVAAMALAYVLSPAVDLLKKGKIPHVAAVLIVMTIGAVALAGTAYLIFQESMGLASELPEYYATVKSWLIEGFTVYDSFQKTTGPLLPVLDESLVEGISFADFSSLSGYIFKGIGSFFSSVLGLAMIILLTLFLLLDGQSLRQRMTIVMGGDPAVSRRIIDDINRQIRGFMLVKFLTTVGLAIVFTIGLLILDVGYAYVWGPLAAVLNLIPYAGAFIGMVPPVVAAAIQTGGLTIPLWALSFMVIVQLLESNWITPKLLGDQSNLNLLAVLVSTVYWGWLWGMVGILLAVPITAAIKVVCAHIEPLKPIAILLGSDADLTPAKAG